jgi:sugar-specific transcriptional regulator TrmB
MDIHTLEDVGLTNPQARAYLSLVEDGGTNAPIIATRIGESRTNAYKVLDKLCELGLATKDQQGKRVRYFPASPTALERLVQEQASRLTQRERKLKAAMPQMLEYFLARSEQPSIRYFQGKEGMRQIFSDMLGTGKTLYLVRSPEDVRFYDEDFFAEIRKKRRLLGTKTVGLTPDVPSANHDPEVDFKNKFIRTWIPADAYTANVEWNISGDKVALISYGKEAMGIIIESPQIAESFRQIFGLAAGSQSSRRQRSNRPAA